MSKEIPRYRKCKHYVFGGFFKLDEDERKHYCAPNAKTLRERSEQKQEIDIANCEKCNNYKSKFIEYPLTIDRLEIKNPEVHGICFKPVEVRLCKDNKTYFGILLGDFPLYTTATFNETDKKLKIYSIANPCIILPEQNKIVFGCESWWREIKPGENISNITDIDIENTWYVKLLKEFDK